MSAKTDRYSSPYEAKLGPDPISIANTNFAGFTYSVLLFECDSCQTDHGLAVWHLRRPMSKLIGAGIRQAKYEFSAHMTSLKHAPSVPKSIYSTKASRGSVPSLASSGGVSITVIDLSVIAEVSSSFVTPLTAR